MSEAYPLAWPLGWPRAARPQRASFRASFGAARDDVFNELRLLGARNVVMSTNVELRRDGLPYASRPEPDDKGVAVYFILRGEEQCIPCDKWDKVADNLRAIVKTINALRGLERWGAKEMVDAAFRGFKALPAGGSEVEYRAPWQDVLEVNRDASREEITAAYRRLAKETHPDKGGNPDHFQLVQRAYQEAIA